MGRVEKRFGVTNSFAFFIFMTDGHCGDKEEEEDDKWRYYPLIEICVFFCVVFVVDDLASHNFNR